MGIVGTNRDDNLVYTWDEKYIAGLGGNDRLTIGSADPYSVAFGGSGNDTYNVNGVGVKLFIADSSGNDTISVPFNSTELGHQDNAWHAVLDGQHYYLKTTKMEVLVMNFLGEGKIENVTFRDGVTIPFDEVWKTLHTLNLRQGSLSDNNFADKSTIDEYMALNQKLQQVETLNATLPAAPVWFDPKTYVTNKAFWAIENGQQSNATEMTKALESADFYGPDGMYAHFNLYGQWEGVSPVPFFDNNYYFQSKAAGFYGIDISQVTGEQVSAMKEDFGRAGLNAWSHYQQYGNAEGVDASARFDTSAYMQAKLQQVQQTNSRYTMEQLERDFANAGLNAVTHYLAYGKDEGINPVGVSEPFPTDYAVDAA